MEVVRKNYTLEIEEPTIHVDNGARGRSGHMSHALASFAPNTFIDFNANYSAVRNGGHYCYGWIEYSISKDSGKTFTELRTFPYSMKCFEDGLYTISVEKAVGCDDGTIVAFCLRNSALENMFCVPWEPPPLSEVPTAAKPGVKLRNFANIKAVYTPLSATKAPFTS